MSNTVEIIIKAVDRASGNISKATSGLDKFKSGFQSLTGFSLGAAGGIAAAGMAIGKVVDFTKQAVTETVDYVSSIKDMARVIGLTTEETSRLVQASDDLFISQDQLKTALLAASRQGIDVSIPGLKKLSAEYLSLGTAAERSQFVMKTFGKSGADMGKLMEIGADGIDAAMASIQDSLVVTKESVINIENYKRSVDNLSDSWMGVKMTIGNAVIPQLDLLFRVLTKGKDSTEEYYQSVNSIQNKISKLAGPAAMGNKAAAAEVERLRAELAALEDSFYNTEVAVDKTGEVVEKVTLKFFSMRDAMKGAAIASGTMAKNITSLNDIDPNFGDKIKDELDKIKFLEAGGGKLQGLHDQILQQFEVGGLGSELATTLLSEITVANAALAVQTGEMTSNQATQIIKDTLTVTRSEATKMLNQWIADNDGKTIQINAVLKYSAFGGSIGSAELAANYDLNGNGIIGKASGGPVWGGKPYLVGERGPELFMPAQNGSIVPNRKLSGTAINFYGDAYFDIREKDVAANILQNIPVRL